MQSGTVHQGHDGGGRCGDHPTLGGVALDFVNTVACRACRTSDGLSSAEELGRWNVAHAGLPLFVMTGPVLDELRILREELRDSFAAQAEGKPPTPPTLARINRTLRGSRTYLRAGYADGRWQFEEVTEGTAPDELWMATVLRATANLLESPLANKLRKCQAPACNHFLVSRRRGQRWCSPTGCGNRVRVARHYRKAKHLAASGPSPVVARR